MLKVLFQTLVVSIFTFLWFPEAFGQPVLPSDLKKPKKYENKKLGAEKSEEKKWKGPRKFIQNTVTHYNWYFNANYKLDQVIERAKLAHRDDYGSLLTFYNYTLDKTAGEKTELDSVIFKSNTGILSHDLRNAWIDNLYMLIGKAYYFRNQLDSAYLTFQYINYAFSPKEPDGYDMPIGSNANEGTNALSVSTKEKNNIVRNALSTPPSRNESFIWQIRTYLESDKLPEAASLIETIKNDPLFPERLKTDLNEVQAHYFYKRKMYDSAATYLQLAMPNAGDRQEASRWEYLTAQLYELAKKPGLAAEFYDKARKRTLDPVLEVHAILNSIKQNSGDSAAIKKNIEDLQKMGRRDRYQKYRDIIYYTAAEIELERDNIPGAKAMLLKSTEASIEIQNPEQRTRSFLLLGDICYHERNYPDAKRFYDSVNNNDPGLTDAVAFDARKIILARAVEQMDIIHRQDSLQQLAAMPEAARNTLLKKMLRQLRKKQGLKEEEETTAGNAAVGLNNNNNKPAPDLFNNNSKGEWYFNNPSLKSKGFTSFKQNWGNRPNVDNWRRQSAIVQANAAAKLNNRAGQPNGASDTTADADNQLNIASLLKNIPLTPEQLETSEDSVANAMVELGILYIDQFEQYSMAIDTLERFTEKYSYHARYPEALYYLYLSYKKIGNEAKALRAKADLDRKYSGSKYQEQLDNALTGKKEKEKTKLTTAYNNIYNLFIEGNFEEAIKQKKINDSISGPGYWTPQLLYIESVYYLHGRQDDEAKKTLNNIIEQFPDDPMAGKAKNILDVLGRRKEIEDYLTKLEIKRIEDTVLIANAPAAPREKVGTPMIQDSTTIQPLKKPVLINDTVKTDKPVINAPDIVIKKDAAKTEPATVFTFNVEAAHAVVVVLNKVDPVYVTESRNAFNRYNKEKFYNRTIEITNENLNDSLKLVIMRGFENAGPALEYLEKTQKVAATQIVPWLPAAKYSFLIISENNIEVLKNNQDINGYRKFQERYLPKQ